jgi:glucokinase
MSRDRRVAVGVEIGGGQAAVALIDEEGEVCQRGFAKTLRGRSATATLEPYLRAIDSLLASAQSAGWRVTGVGVSVPGTIEPGTGRALQIPLLPSLNNFPLIELLEARYALPSFLSVDVEAAALGEYYFGAGRGLHRLLFLTMNAVVGAALVVDGQVVPSTQRCVGHVSHFPISVTGPRCSCGKRGCINTLVSLDAMQKMVQRALRRGEETSLVQRFLNREAFSPRLLAEEAGRGDNVALQISNEIAHWLGVAISKYIDLFEPDLLALGGYALEVDRELLLAQVQATQTVGVLSSVSGHSRSLSSVCSLVEVAPARLGRDVTLVGAVTQLF